VPTITPADHPVGDAGPLNQRVSRLETEDHRWEDLNHPDADQQLQIERELGRHEENHQQRVDLPDPIPVIRLSRFAAPVEGVSGPSRDAIGFGRCGGRWFPKSARHANEPRMTSRIDRRFQRLAAERRPALVTFIMAGDPDPGTSLNILRALPAAGADVIELGMPFTDPMADGPAIQAAGLRALKAGQTLRATLKMIAAFRSDEADTPVTLMGYFNPIYAYGVQSFLRDARLAGVDGLVVVDCPSEEDDELCGPARNAGLAFIRLATPTTDDARLPAILTNASGFVYYVSITGVTGSATPDPMVVGRAVARIKRHTPLPVAVGFGVKDASSAAAIAATADGVVVGSALVEAVRHTLRDGMASPTTVAAVTGLVKELAQSCRIERSTLPAN